MLKRFTYQITPPYIENPYAEKSLPILPQSYFKDTAVHYRATYHTFSSGDNPQQLQGGCYWKNNKVILLNTDNTHRCMLSCLNLTTDTIEWQTQQIYPFGHGNSMTCINDDLYISHGNENIIFHLDLNTFEYESISTARPYSTISHNAGIFYGCSDGILYILSADFHTDTPVCRYDNSFGLVQSGFIKDNVMWQVYAYPNLLVSYSATNGELLNIYNLKSHSNGYPIGESECCFFYPEGNCIMLGSSARYRDNIIDGKNYKLNQLFLVGNVSENYPLIYTGSDGSFNSNLTSNRNIFTDVSTTSIYQTGTAAHPMRFFADACGLASLLDRADVNIRVTHTGDNSHGYLLKSGTVHLDVDTDLTIDISTGVHTYIDGGGSCTAINNHGYLYLNDTTSCDLVTGYKGSTSICKGTSRFTGVECTVEAGLNCSEVSGRLLTITSTGTVNLTGTMEKQVSWLFASGTPRLLGTAGNNQLFTCTTVPDGYELVFDLSAFKIIKPI